MREKEETCSGGKYGAYKEDNDMCLKKKSEEEGIRGKREGQANTREEEPAVLPGRKRMWKRTNEDSRTGTLVQLYSLHIPILVRASISFGCSRRTSFIYC